MDKLTPQVPTVFETVARVRYSERCFYLRDADGSIIARGQGTYAFLNLETGRPERPGADQTDPYGTHEPLRMPSESRHIALPDRLEPRDPITVRRHHIDTNEHVNNSQYVQMALEFAPRDAEPHLLRVDYRRAAVLGDIMYPQVSVGPDRTVVALCDKSSDRFAVVEMS